MLPFKLRKTLEGQDVCIEAVDITVNASLIIQKDIECDDGIIHVVDTILVPKNVSCEPNTNYYHAKSCE